MQLGEFATKLGKHILPGRDRTASLGQRVTSCFLMACGMRVMIVESLTPCHDGSVFTDQ
jgi:hypothetical protein